MKGKFRFLIRREGTAGRGRVEELLTQKCQQQLNGKSWSHCSGASSRCWTPDEGSCCSLPAGTQILVSRPQGWPSSFLPKSLNTFFFFIFHPWWSKTLTVTDPRVVITNLSFLHIFKVLFLCICVAIDNNQTSHTPAFHCNQTVWK